ncbi:hypothetical protein VVR12_03205 [Rothia sp. LK2588]|uniref:hypothetical protein n=1 Tax=Rothia sp. LK2588 TaxID=3114369 RepID=UPI0034CDD6CF
MKPTTWYAAATATLIFGYTAPITDGNGATLLYMLAVAAVTLNNPLTRKTARR